jgi:uncharacterized protein (DUF1499 family)
MIKPFFLSGSKSTDFDFPATHTHPLPACPDSPNCIRISIPTSQETDIIWERILSALQKMDPAKIDKRRSQYRIDSVFRIFVFKDDFSLKLQAIETGTLMHIRSASREGYSDLGVNRRRVKRFLKLLESVIQQ